MKICLSILSNSDEKNFFSELLMKNFKEVLHDQEVWKIDAFDNLIKNFSSHKNLETNERNVINGVWIFK